MVADVMYETWFVAAAESLALFLDLSNDSTVPSAPERDGLSPSFDKLCRELERLSTPTPVPIS